MENEIQPEVPVVNQEQPKKDWKTLIRERKDLPQIIGIVILVVVILVTIGISSFLILKSNNSNITGIANNTKNSPLLNKAPLAVNSTGSGPTPSNPKRVRPVVPTPTPTPKPLLPGPHVFSVGANDSIKVDELYISSLATKVGDSQTFRLTIEDSNAAVNSVSVKLVTDHKSNSYTLSLKSGDGKNGVWEGTWKADDTHDHTYQAQIMIKDSSGHSFYFEPTFR